MACRSSVQLCAQMLQQLVLISPAAAAHLLVWRVLDEPM
jgi:hypothetical protein